MIYDVNCHIDIYTVCISCLMVNSLADSVGQLFGLDVERLVVLFGGGEISQLLGEHSVEEERSRSALVLKSERTQQCL